MFCIGLDLGRRHDHSAIAIVEREHTGESNARRTYSAQRPDTPAMIVRRVQRIALGTPYPRVVQMIRELVQSPGLARCCTLVVDGTGLGAPVVDMLREADLACELTPVTITGGENQSRRAGSWVSVPKRDLIAGVQLGLEKGELKIARGMKEAGALVRELIAMRQNADGGEHDDLVLALALACWKARRWRSVNGTTRLPAL